MYDKLTDEEIINLINQGDKEAMDFLIDKYKDLVKRKSRAYYIKGADKEDLIQEGMIGLYKSIRDYKQGSFYHFAELCVNRQIYTAIKNSTRQKQWPLNYYISFANLTKDETNENFYAAPKADNPEQLYLGRESRAYIEKKLRSELSRFEYRVLSLYLQGKSYKEISEIVTKDEKSVDNAIQRVRRKMTALLD